MRKAESSLRTNYGVLVALVAVHLNTTSTRHIAGISRSKKPGEVGGSGRDQGPQEKRRWTDTRTTSEP